MIRGITFAEQVFYSADFAHYMNFFLNGGVGITKGCSVTQDGTKVTIGTGYFVAHGRLMNVEVAEVITAAKGFKSGYNRIVYEIDLSKQNTITEFKQGYIKVLNTESLTQQDLDATGSIYQFPFCHFQWSGTAISGFVVDAPTLVLDDIMKQWSDNYGNINKQFDTWFAQKKTETENWVLAQKQDFDQYVTGKEQELQAAVNKANTIIGQLEADGFEKKAVYKAATMTAAGWNKSGKTYSFEAQYPHENYDIEIQPADTITADQLDAYNSALIVGNINSNIATAKGDVPTVDIPIIIKVVAKYA